MTNVGNSRNEMLRFITISRNRSIGYIIFLSFTRSVLSIAKRYCVSKTYRIIIKKKKPMFVFVVRDKRRKNSWSLFLYGLRCLLWPAYDLKEIRSVSFLTLRWISNIFCFYIMWRYVCVYISSKRYKNQMACASVREQRRRQRRWKRVCVRFCHTYNKRARARWRSDVYIICIYASDGRVYARRLRRCCGRVVAGCGERAAIEGLKFCRNPECVWDFWHGTREL